MYVASFLFLILVPSGRIQHLQERLEADVVGWVELFDAPLITSDKRHYLLRLPMNDGDSGAFRQIAMITINVMKLQSACLLLSSSLSSHLSFFLLQYSFVC